MTTKIQINDELRKTLALEILFPTFKNYVKENALNNYARLSEERLKKFALSRISTKEDLFDIVQSRFDLKNKDILQYVNFNEIWETMSPSATWVRIDWSYEIPTNILTKEFERDDIRIVFGTLDASEELYFIDLEDALLVLDDELEEQAE